MERQFSTELSSSAQAAYSDLLDAVRSDELARSIGNLSGSFSKKTVRGVAYWYYQATNPLTRQLKQIFVGPDEENVRALVRKAKAKNPKPIAALANAAAAHGCASTPPVHYRIIRRLNETGLFRAGAVLLGSHAFLAYGNMLGIAWKERAFTQDIDFAHAGRFPALALPQNLSLDTRSVVETLESGFMPIQGFFPGDQTASFRARNDKTLRLDFLTPMQGSEKPFLHPGLGINLQPIRFMEFLLEDVTQAVVISRAGASLVNVPDPARYALHKLLVYAERRKRDPAKALKDLRQAVSLTEFLWDHRRENLRSLWQAIVDSGPGWRKRAREGLAALRRNYPQLAALAALSAIKPSPRKAPVLRKNRAKPRRKP